MSAPTFPYRHSLTGQIERLTEDQASAFPEYLERVSEDAKPYEPGLFKPGKVGEFKNPEPLTDAEIAAQDELAEAKKAGATSAAAKKAAKKAADAEKQAKADAAAAEKADADARAAAEAATTTPTGTPGENQE